MNKHQATPNTICCLPETAVGRRAHIRAIVSLRLVAVRERELAREVAATSRRRRELEEGISRTLGFAVPLRGQQLLNEIARTEQAVQL